MRIYKFLALLIALSMGIAPCFALSETQIDAALGLIIEEKDVLKKIEQNNIAEARKTLPLEIKQARKEGKENTAALQILALLDFREHKYDKALAYLLQVEKYQHKDKAVPPCGKLFSNFALLLAITTKEISIRR